MTADTALRQILDELETLQSYLSEPHDSDDIRRALALVARIRRTALLGVSFTEPPSSGKTGKTKRSKKA